MNNEAETRFDFMDTLPNSICIEYNLTDNDIFPLEEINIKDECFKYENVEQKVPQEPVAINQNVDSKPDFLEIEESKVTCDLNIDNFDDDFQTFIHYQFKPENGQLDISLPETDLYDKEILKSEKEYLSTVFNFNCDDIPDMPCIECNAAQKDICPLPEIDTTKSECLEIEDSKVLYTLDSQNVADYFKSFTDTQCKSEDDQMDDIPPETKVCDKEEVADEKIYNCSKCELKFNSESSFIVHLKTKHIVNTDGKLFKCDLCGCESKYKSSIDRHMKTKHTVEIEYKAKPAETYTRKAEMFKCNLCGYETKHQSNIVSHVKNTHKERKCPKCTYKTDSKSELRKHLTTHGVCDSTDFKRFIRTENNVYKCKLCEYECKHRSSMYRHMLNKHYSVKEHKCSQCDYGTHYMEQLKQHLLDHEDVRPYECEVCKKRFRLKHYLKDHSWSHAGEKRFQCSQCDYKNNQKSAINVHMKNKHFEDENRDYKCKQCDYETNNKNNLNRHIKQHLLGVEKEFKCPQCSYNTNFKSDLNLHVRNKHELVKQYKCDRCKYETNYKTKIKQHVLDHDSVKVYECGICDKLFKSNISLKKHIRSIHLGERRYHCAHCDYKTYKKFNLLIHVNCRHTTACERKHKRHQGCKRHLKNRLVKLERPSNVCEVLTEEPSKIP